MRKTKIVCTMGPSTESYDMIKTLIEAGMNVARFNFSHGTHESQKKMLDLVKQVRSDMGVPLATMLDTKGPEYRIKTFEKGSIELKDGSSFILTADDVIGNEERVSVNYYDLPKDLEEGDIILLNDGMIKFSVNKINGNDILCDVITGGILSDRKSMAFPGKTLKQVYLSENDKKDLLFGIEQGFDFVACSFVSVKQDLDDVRAFLDAHGGQDIVLIAKIENQSGVDNIEDICKSCDGVMVARGDMGVEIDYEKLPVIQKKLIATCRRLGKRSVTATEMLESMTNNPRPTRAEISDVANAVYDGTSAVMLSGETAAGKYPEEAVLAMAKITESTENAIDYKERFYSSDFKITSVADAVSHSTCDMALTVGAKVIVACTKSGMTARMISRFRSPLPIIGLTPSEKTFRSLALSYGVVPVKCEIYNSGDEMIESARQSAISTFKLEKGDNFVVTSGITQDEDSFQSNISVETVL